MDGLAQRAASGVAFMMVRQVVSMAVSFVAGVLLARTLTPAEYGAMALLTLLVNVASIVTDLGLSASLVRQIGSPTARQADGVIGVQAVLAVSATVVLLLGLPILERWGHGVSHLDLALALTALAILPMPVSSVALALLESRLAFRSVGIVLALQSVTFSLVACLLAMGGFGIVSAGAGLLVTNVLSAAAAVTSARWLPRPSFPAVKDLGVDDRLRFGLPFIASTGVSVVKDAVSPMFLGLVFGATAVGYVNWAQTLAVLGMLMLFPLGRVFFPVFVKVREEPFRLQAAVVRATFWSYALVAPISVFVGLNIREVTELVYGDQWLPAVGTLLLLTGANFLSPAVNVLFILLNVQGRPGVTLRYSLSFCVATWLLVPAAASIDDFRGYGWANLLVTAIGLPLVIRMRRYYADHALDMLRPWAAAVVAVVLGRLVGGIADDRAIGLGVSLSVAVVAYIGTLLLLAGSHCRELVQVIRSRSRA